MMANGARGDAAAARVESDITAGEDAVARAEVAFAASLEDASTAGRTMARRLVSGARPVLIGAGLAAVAAIGLRLLLRPRVNGRVPAPAAFATPALLPALGRTVALSFAAVAGRWLAERWVASRSQLGDGHRERHD
jgi:hypothetical protein